MRTFTISLLAACTALALGCQENTTGIELRFLERSDDGGAWGQIIADFEAAHPGIDVDLVEGPASTDVRESMYATAFLAGDTTYDLVFMDVIWVAKFASRGWLLPLDDRFPPEARRQFLPGDIEGSIYEDSIYRVPMCADAGVLFYRKDLIAAPPETFEELLTLAREHSRSDDLHGFVFPAHQYEGLVCTFLEILWGHGGDVLDPDGSVVLDSPQAKQALQWMVSLVGDVSPEAVTTYQEEESRHVFHEGKAVFLRNWPYVWTKAQEEGAPVRGKIGMAPMVHLPGHPSAAVLGGWGFGIAKTCRTPDAAWAFIEFATRAESMKIMNHRNGEIPARHSLYTDTEMLAAHPHYPDLYKVLLASRPRPVHPKYPQISDAIQVHVSSALVGRETPEEAIVRAASAIRAILSR